MTIRRILKQKAIGEIVTVSPEASVAEATRLLAEKRIGALVASSDGRTIAGVLSERDIVRELGKRGTGCLDDRVADLMTREVRTVSPDTLALRALDIMTQGRFRHLPVVEGNVMVGVVSIGDVVKYRLEEIQRENAALTDMITGHV
jgi:CBS domain-containing protein